tara:strand:+ start:5314 stop:5814 length:501 start_codon:yes stop_codon:yes gene_type:complete
MPVSRAFPDAVTTVDTAAQYELGTEWPMDAGEAEDLDSTVVGPQTWIYVENDVAAALAWVEGNVIAFKLGQADYKGIQAPINSAMLSLIGVAQHAVAAGSFGWILRRGVGEVLAGTGGITVNLPLTCSSTGGELGKAINGSATESCFARATEEVLATALATCYIRL